MRSRVRLSVFVFLFWGEVILTQSPAPTLLSGVEAEDDFDYFFAHFGKSLLILELEKYSLVESKGKRKLLSVWKLLVNSLGCTIARAKNKTVQKLLKQKNEEVWKEKIKSDKLKILYYQQTWPIAVSNGMKAQTGMSWCWAPNLGWHYQVSPLGYVWIRKAQNKRICA